MKHPMGKKKKLLIMLPLFVAPVLGLVFLFMGGQTAEKPTNEGQESAFNASLPSAHVKESGENKLEIYMQAEKDSAKRQDQLQAEALQKNLYDPAPPLGEQLGGLESNRQGLTSQKGDPNERQVTERLDRLMKEINEPLLSGKAVEGKQAPIKSLPDEGIQQLEKLLVSMQSADGAPDPEMRQIETVLEKVLDIQHPERVKERLLKKGEPIQKTDALYVTTQPKDELQIGNGFYGIQDEQAVTAAREASTVSAVVHEEQVVQDGSTIKLRLSQGIFVGDTYIPKGILVSGKCGFNGDRVNIQLKEIVYNKTIYPVSLAVYDMDGLAGINVPGVMGSDIAKNGIGQTIQEVDILQTNPSVAAQVATTGIQTAKNLLTKKVKAVKATIKAGHQLLLKMNASY